MTIHAIPSIPRRSSDAMLRWYARIEREHDGPIRGTATGRHASWIELDAFEVLSRSKERRPPGFVVIFVKKQDVATAEIVRAMVAETRFTLRVDLDDTDRTLFSGVFSEAFITNVKIRPGHQEEIAISSMGMKWTRY